MGRPFKEPPCSSSLVPIVLRYAAERGLDVEALGWRFALPPDAVRREVVPAAVDAPNELLRVVAGTTAEADVAIRVACAMSSRRHSLAELAVRASATLRDALVLLARWVPLLHPGFDAALAEGAGEHARWVLRTPRRPRGVGPYVHELAIAYTIQRARDGAGPLTPSHVWFQHPRPSNVDRVRSFFGPAELTFGCDTSGFSVDPVNLDRRMRLADPLTVQTIAPLVDAELGDRHDRGSFAEKVAAHVASSLPDSVDVAETARAMHMSSRTLQRRLEQEETRFTEVLDNARCGLARNLLADLTLSLADVASRLGFADLATFSRAFKRWTGKPPGQWRQS
ncbi:MAG: AraC family transcriptional regulator ligand-binding domain-containing protein [Polyangiaceae bacterium]|jgi:AraC-like DNA-binding protein